jgi:hypothetical protein
VVVGGREQLAHRVVGRRGTLFGRSEAGNGVLGADEVDADNAQATTLRQGRDDRKR